jgi:hypothetical protein
MSRDSLLMGRHEYWGQESKSEIELSPFEEMFARRAGDALDLYQMDRTPNVRCTYRSLL